jgi:hypothetical protein
VLVEELGVASSNIRGYSCEQVIPASRLRRRLLGSSMTWAVSLSLSASLAAVGFEDGGDADAFAYASYVAATLLSEAFAEALNSTTGLEGLAVDPPSVVVALAETGRKWTRIPSPPPTFPPSPSPGSGKDDDGGGGGGGGGAGVEAASSSSLLIMVCGGAVLALAVCVGAARVLRKKKNNRKPPAVKLSEHEEGDGTTPAARPHSLAAPSLDVPVEWLSPISAAALEASSSRPPPPQEEVNDDNEEERRRTSRFAFINPLRSANPKKNKTRAGGARKSLFG